MKKNRHNRVTEEYDYDEEYIIRGKKKESPRRRETRNWKKTWNKFQDNSYEIDDFYTKR
jgi:hypothetical protein